MKNGKLLFISLSLIIIGFAGLYITSYFYYSWPSTNTISTWSNNNPMQNMMNNMMGGRSTARKSSKTKFSSNGERIYYTATSKSNKPIKAQIGMMGVSSSYLACVDCHGADGKGQTMNMMMGSYKVPNITYEELFEEEKHTERDVKKAITEGVNHDGKELNFPMPIWKMSEKDFNDLIAYLKTL